MSGQCRQPRPHVSRIVDEQAVARVDVADSFSFVQRHKPDSRAESCWSASAETEDACHLVEAAPLGMLQRCDAARVGDIRVDSGPEERGPSEVVDVVEAGHHDAANVVDVTALAGRDRGETTEVVADGQVGPCLGNGPSAC